jgi:hypothetical protein
MFMDDNSMDGMICMDDTCMDETLICMDDSYVNN